MRLRLNSISRKDMQIELNTATTEKLPDATKLLLRPPIVGWP